MAEKKRARAAESKSSAAGRPAKAEPSTGRGGGARPKPKAAKPKAAAVPVAERRGLAKKLDYGWHVMLAQSPDGQADADAFLDALIERKMIGGARRDVAADLFAGRVPGPLGPWGLLVQLVGHPWLYLVGDGLRHEWPKDLAAQLGLRTAYFSADGMIAVLHARAYEVDAMLLEFRAGLPRDESDPNVVFPPRKDEGMVVHGPRLSPQWLRQFKTLREAHDGVARELGVYVPVLMHASSQGKADVWGHDGRNLKPADYRRIDVVTFGDASTLEPTAAAFDLAKAIRAADAAGVRAAIAAGADARYLPDYNNPSLHAAFYLPIVCNDGRRDDADGCTREQKLAVIQALLEAGVPPDAPGREPAIHQLFNYNKGYDQGTIIAQLRLLLDHGADPNLLGTMLHSEGNTPLHHARSHRWLAVMKYLVSRGTDATRPNVQGRTPLQELEWRLTQPPFGTTEDAATAAIREFLRGAEHGEPDTSGIDELVAQSRLEWDAAQVAHRREIEETRKEMDRLWGKS